MLKTGLIKEVEFLTISQSFIMAWGK